MGGGVTVSHRCGRREDEGFSGSYAVHSVPGAGLAILGAVRVGGQAATGV